MPYSEAAQVYPYTPIGTLVRRRLSRSPEQALTASAANSRASMPVARPDHVRLAGRARGVRRRPAPPGGRREDPRARTRSTARQFADWASGPRRASSPATIDVRALRRYAAGLSERGHAPATVARKLAALRGLFRVQMELGARAENPADLLELAQEARSACRAC